MLPKTVTGRLFAFLAVFTSAGAACGQAWSEAEAVEAAVAIALACGDGPPGRLVADSTVFKTPEDPLSYPPGRGTWLVTFGKTVVTVSDGVPHRYSWSGPKASTFLDVDETPFEPFYSSVPEAVERARAFCRSLGSEGLESFVEAGSSIPEPGDDGKIRNRTVRITLNEAGPGFPCIAGGNHADIALDAVTGTPFHISLSDGFDFEQVPTQYIGEAEAIASLRTAVGLGEVRSIRGPGYMELLGGGQLTTEGRSFRERAVLPLVYSITGDNFHGAVSALSGKVLRTRSRAGIGSLPGPSAASSSQAAAGGGKPSNGTGYANPRQPGVPFVQVLLTWITAGLACAGVLVWFFLRGRASRLG